MTRGGAAPGRRASGKRACDQDATSSGVGTPSARITALRADIRASGETAVLSDDELAEFRDRPERMRELHDSLQEAFGLFASSLIDASSPGVKMIEDACRANLETVRDPELRERLRPSYRAACKRLIISDGFYEAIKENALLQKFAGGLGNDWTPVNFCRSAFSLIAS